MENSLETLHIQSSAHFIVFEEFKASMSDVQYPIQTTTVNFLH